MTGNETRRELLAERDAVIALFERAQNCLHIVEPAEIRESLRWILETKIALCRAHQSVLGLSVMHVKSMAQSIVEICKESDRDDQS